MASPSISDFVSLAEEKFDFDISLSPASSKGDNDVEDEVFMGPVGKKEKCISKGVEADVTGSLSSGPSLGEEPSWSPLTGEKFDQICKEAHLIASHLEQTLTQSVAESSTLSCGKTEIFEEDPGAKLTMFCKPAVLSPIKRETFLVQDSPMKQLPPAFQKRMLKANWTPLLNTSSPLRPSVSQTKMGSRCKALVSSSGVLPSKPTAQGTSRRSIGTKPQAAAKTLLPPPSKCAIGLKGLRPSCRNARSSEDLLSDNTSVASDVSDSSLNTSLPGKSSISARNQQRELRGLKASSLQNSRVVDRRRNTSSSSSSVSSINSSLTISPGTKAKLNSSLNSSTSSVGPSRRNPEPGVRRRSTITTQARRPSEVFPRPIKATPVKKVDLPAAPRHQTPVKKLERTSSLPSVVKTRSVLRANPRLKAPVVPTPTSYLKMPHKSDAASVSPDAPRVMKPKRLLSMCSVDSAPDHPATPGVFLTPVCKLRRPSALPTPLSRRTSGIPGLTPRSASRSARTSQTLEHSTSFCQAAAPASSPRNELDSAVSGDGACPPAELPPCPLAFNLENESEESQTCEPTVLEKPSDPPSCDPEPSQDNVEALVLPDTGDALTKSLETNKDEHYFKEVLLVDAPAPALQLSEKLLIDLSNTPDLIKTSSAKTWGETLIDLSSPLIKWSPEAKKQNTENEVPLIDLSF